MMFRITETLLRLFLLPCITKRLIIHHRVNTKKQTGTGSLQRQSSNEKRHEVKHHLTV